MTLSVLLLRSNSRPLGNHRNHNNTGLCRWYTRTWTRVIGRNVDRYTERTADPLRGNPTVRGENVNLWPSRGANEGHLLDQSPRPSSIRPDVDRPDSVRTSPVCPVEIAAVTQVYATSRTGSDLSAPALIHHSVERCESARRSSARGRLRIDRKSRRSPARNADI